MEPGKERFEVEAARAVAHHGPASSRASCVAHAPSPAPDMKSAVTSELVVCQDLRQPLQRHLVALVCSAAVVAGVLSVFVCDAGLMEVVTEQPVTPVQAVVVARARVQQNAGQF